MAIRFSEPLTKAQAALVLPKLANAEPIRTLSLGRPKSGKTIVTLRLDPDVVSALKADGAGWQPRANALLRKALGL